MSSNIKKQKLDLQCSKNYTCKELSLQHCEICKDTKSKNLWLNFVLDKIWKVNSISNLYGFVF